jgi:hypothetical protein
MTHNTEHKTGTRDVTYNLVSVLYHALQGAETYVQYVEDAKQGGDNDCAQFFQEVLQDEQKRADRAKALLQRRLGQSAM